MSSPFPSGLFLLRLKKTCDLPRFLFRASAKALLNRLIRLRKGANHREYSNNNSSSRARDSKLYEFLALEPRPGGRLRLFSSECRAS